MFKQTLYNITNKRIAFALWIMLMAVLSSDLHAQKRRVTGTVEGRITAPIKNDMGKDATINTIGLSGLQVDLRYKKGGSYYLLGTTYTDEMGNYSISYDKMKKGNKFSLYLRILAQTNPSFNIRSKNSGGVYTHNHYIGSYSLNAGTIIEKNVHINDNIKGDAFRSVHWARKGMNFFREQSLPLKGGLTIKINKKGSYANNYIYGKYPVIHLRKKNGISENSMYHEFGHYAMYRLQNNHIKIPYGERGVNKHRKRDENTGLLAWIEGWAIAIQTILDAAHWQEDNELGLDANLYTYENLEKFAAIKNGFRSEYHIGTALYDLWDGENKGLPEKTPCLKIHGWDDSEINTRFKRSYYQWKSKDDVELDFAQICAPLQTVKKRSDLKKLRNIGNYYEKLLAQLPDCKDRANVSRLFRENRVLWNIEDYEKELYTSNLSSDQFFTTKSKKERGFLRMEFPFIFSKWTDHYSVNIPARDDAKQYSLYALPNTSLALTDNYWIGIYDPKKGIYEKMDFYLNPNTNSSKNNLMHGHFYTCGGNEILVRNGCLELGMENSKYTAELTINEGSLLRIDEHGKLILNHNTILRIASGGTLHIKYKEAVILRGNASVIVEEGGSLIEP